MSVSSLTGMNYGGQLLKGPGGLGGYPQQQVDDDLTRLYKRGYRMVRIASTSEDAGSTYTTYLRNALTKARTLGFNKILYGMIQKFPSKVSQWDAFATQKLLDAAYVNSLNDPRVWLIITNEADAQFNMGSENGVTVTRLGSLLTITTTIPHGSIVGDSYVLSGVNSLNPTSSVSVHAVIDAYTFTYTTGFGGSDGTLSTGSLQNSPSTIRKRIRSLATTIKGLYPNVNMYASVAQGGGAGWISDPTHEGDLTNIGFNIYGETFGNSQARYDNFVAQVDPMYAQFGSKLWITEWSLHASYGSFPTDKSEQRYWIKKRFDYLESKGIPHFFFTYRSSSYVGQQIDDFAIRFTWDDMGKTSLYIGLSTKEGYGERWADILERRHPDFIDLRTY